jgi:DNA repair protein RadC
MAVRMGDLPADSRPRERLWRVGAGSLSDQELVALVIRSGVNGEGAVGLAARLLADVGTLSALSVARSEELARLGGIGQAKAASLVAAFELGRRAGRRAEEPAPVTSSAALAELVRPALTDPRTEQVAVAILNAALRPIRVVRLTSGSADRCLIPIRDVLACVLRHDGVAFAIAHNHPSGDPTPSPQDMKATGALATAAESVGLRFLDHLIVTSAASVSLRERRLGWE